VDQQQLVTYLDQLNVEISELQAPESDKARLSELIAEIERQLISTVIESEPHTLVEQVEVMVTQFEEDHPAVASILNNIMLTLTNMGV
jgi:hypothetical protein